MSMKLAIVVLLSATVGFMITLISGFFMTPFLRMGVDVVHRGMPLPWSIQVIPRSANVLWVSFVEDVAFWILIALAISALVQHFSTRKKL